MPPWYRGSSTFGLRNPNRTEWVLVDFKSDRIRGTDVEIARTLTDRYRAQLDYYEMAIVQSTGKQVRKRYIWLFDAEKAYEIDRIDTFQAPSSQRRVARCALCYTEKNNSPVKEHDDAVGEKEGLV